MNVTSSVFVVIYVSGFGIVGSGRNTVTFRKHVTQVGRLLKRFYHVLNTGCVSRGSMIMSPWMAGFNSTTNTLHSLVNSALYWFILSCFIRREWKYEGRWQELTCVWYLVGFFLNILCFLASYHCPSKVRLFLNGPYECKMSGKMSFECSVILRCWGSTEKEKSWE